MTKTLRVTATCNVVSLIRLLRRNQNPAQSQLKTRLWLFWPGAHPFINQRHIWQGLLAGGTPSCAGSLSEAAILFLQSHKKDTLDKNMLGCRAKQATILQSSWEKETGVSYGSASRSRLRQTFPRLPKRPRAYSSIAWIKLHFRDVTINNNNKNKNLPRGLFFFLQSAVRAR